MLRDIALYQQGLVPGIAFGKGLPGTRRVIEHLGYVQIDSLSVVERAHHHVLWNRVPGYKQRYLNDLVRKRHIFEYWYHAASYLPMGDYRYAMPNMESIRRGENRYYLNVDERLMKKIISRIKTEGPLRVRDLEKRKNESGSWWSWGPGKRALDKLFMQGDLMVCERNGMEKVYDLTERCIADGVDTRMPSLNEYAGYLFDTTLRSHGVMTWKQLLHLKTGKALRDEMRKVVNANIESGIVKSIKNADDIEFYVDTALLGSPPKISNHLKILSPFDNSVIHRERLSSLFNFDYRVECYVKESNRVYGYFSLPILYGNRFIGRLDCKAHRSENRLVVHSLHLEKELFNSSELYSALAQALRDFANFNECSLLDSSVINDIKKY